MLKIIRKQNFTYFNIYWFFLDKYDTNVMHEESKYFLDETIVLL